MRLTVLAGVLGSILGSWGCAFQAGTYGDSTGDPTTAPDAGGGSATQGPDGAPVATRTCAFADPALRLCLDFEDHSFVPRATDASPMHLDAATKNLVELSRDGAVGALVAPISHIQVPTSPALDFAQAMTLELWVRPAYNQTVTLIDNAGLYKLSLTSDHRASCTIAGGTATTDRDTVDTGDWSHIACSYGPSGNLSVYVDGKREASAAVAPAGTSSAGTSGTDIAVGYGGGLDDVKMYASELTADEICAHSGHSDCTE